MAVLAAVSQPIHSAASCGTTGVCGDVTSTLVGELQTQDVKVSWSTNDEDSTVGSYWLLRYDCGDPATCSVLVAIIPAVSSCNTNHDYSYTDDPPNPDNSWIYTVEVRRPNGSRACAVDVEPQ